MRSRAWTRWLAALLTVLAAGCGGGAGDEEERLGGASEEERVGEVVTSFIEAGREQDAGRACSLLAAAQVETVERLGGGSCPQLLGGILSRAASRTTRVEIEEVRIEGRRATVEATLSAEGSAPRAERIRLIREGGEWKLADAGL
jgi:hypothetical protein